MLEDFKEDIYKKSFLEKTGYGFGFLPVFSFFVYTLGKTSQNDCFLKFSLKLVAHALYAIFGIWYLGMGIEEKEWDPREYAGIQKIIEEIDEKNSRRNTLTKIILNENETKN